MTKVLISGASGYIAQHIIKDLLLQGHAVVGTVRSAEKGNNLAKLFNSSNFSFEIANLTEEKAFDKILTNNKDATAFLHTASPLPHNANDNEKEFLIPAVEGTKSVLQSIKDHGSQIEHVVITSSYIAVKDSKNNSPLPYTEDSWNSITWEEAAKEKSLGYPGSKKFAEKAAWDFLEKEKPHFTLTAVNPAYVFGPQAFDEEVKEKLNFSAEFINSIVRLVSTGKMPQFSGAFIDVRDVAKAHITAFTNEKAFGKRLVLYNEPCNVQDIVGYIRENFPQLKVPAVEGNGIRNDPKVNATVDNKKTRKILAFDFIDFEKSLRDSINQILKVYPIS
ncbi:uncharacterized protein PRCAT00005781001 [Priceomyces carsonii]|uniref:uncharacterized protein n=1 Tax=Priceomyces carsonii TaxID=28549 RepID=UPI002ED79588|nr:unnamed protein product [Priceomyces carsonii]